MRKIVAEIHLQAIYQNAKTFSQLTGAKLCAVVKADAYGHGAVETVNALQSIADYFAVSILDEALLIRLATCGKSILIFTPPQTAEEVRQAVYNGFCITVDTLKTAKLVAKTVASLQRPVKVHLKVNTGMNRYGMNAQTLGKTCTYLQAFPLVEVEGIYSHFYGGTLSSLENQHHAFTRLQAICKSYYPSVIRHISASYGALFGKRFAWDMVRIGLGLYGYLPDGARDLPVAIENLNLSPAMQVYAQVSAVRTYQNGGAGYGKPLQPLKNGEKLHVLRAGYADGFLRNDAFGANKFCMDACVVQGNARIGGFVPVMTDADETAKRTGTISYEVLCALNRRTERIYTYDKFTFCRRRTRGYKR